MNRLFSLILLLFVASGINAQLVEVQTNYTGGGDVEFVAHNNSPAPLFLKVDFADLENTSFNEPLPYIQLLDPGFNTLFILERDLDAGVPRFNYQIKSYRSNPMALADLDFPYLIPFSPDAEVSVFDVKNMDGFWGTEEPGSWNATGFKASPGQSVYASRNGIVVEVVGAERTGDPQSWYHTWTNTVTLLQPDGTLICYRNVADNGKKLKIGEKVFAGQQLGEVIPRADEMIMLIFQHSLNSSDLRFIIPRFVISESETGQLLPSRKYSVAHPKEIRGIEMTRREKRRNLN